MKKLLSILFFSFSILVNASTIFYYSPSDGDGGLRFAIEKIDGHWQEIGENFNFVSSDFGAWGSGKKMFDPLLVKEGDVWKVIFKVNKTGSVYGIAESKDLINWKPQEYISADEWLSSPLDQASPEMTTIKVGKHKQHGRFVDMDNPVVESLQSYVEKKNALHRLYSERTDSDYYRFNGLDKVNASLKVSGESKEISPLLLGIFFEDINYAADGGLYGELLQNRDFEYQQSERRHDKKWGPEYGWKKDGKNIHFEILEDNPLSPNNPHYARLIISGETDDHDRHSGLYNYGYDGISLKKDESYRFSMKARSDLEMPVKIELVTSDNNRIASGKLILHPSDKWKSYEVVLKADGTYSDAELRILPLSKGKIDIDMISLFPLNTFKGRQNGLRPDLAQTLADLKPRFVRFPGGCVAHGNGIDNIYDWKGSIGNLEDRKPLSNLWGYHQTRGLGYYEYFLFCEDIGAEPLPVLAAGVPCQNSSTPSRFTKDDLTHYGQQQGIPMDSMASYIQDILDLIEYANGPVTSTWGAKRAEAGHPEPFNLKYIGIGNEDMITEVFKPRFSMIKNAVKEAYPEITVIGTAGPFYEGADYEEGWDFARKENVDMVDEHYYVDPAWLIYNQDFYDDYDRNGPKVYLGEWAAHLPDRASTIETALAEALYITSLERNGDVVSMSSYAPLLAKKNHTQWRPDLIYFDNDSVYPTTDYHVMRLAGEHAGDRYFLNELKVDNVDDKVKARVGASVVSDSSTGETFLKLVNMLPVTTDIDIDLTKIMEGKSNLPSGYKTITLQGSPDAVEAEIKEAEVPLSSPVFNISLSPYSFTLIRI